MIESQIAAAPKDFDPCDGPLCPLCDQPNFNYLELVIVESAECLFLAHKECIEDA